MAEVAHSIFLHTERAWEQDNTIGIEVFFLISFPQSDNLKNSLRIAERIVTQNTYQPKQALYRDLPVLLGEGNY